MLNMMIYHKGFRGVADPEVLHSAWNDAKRALRGACLWGASLKGTLLANVMHGYYLGGKHQVQKEEVLDNLANIVDLDSILDGIIFDRGLEQGAWSEEEIRNEISDWATSRTTLNRGALVTTSALLRGVRLCASAK